MYGDDSADESDHPLDDIAPRRQRELYDRQVSGGSAIPLSSDELKRCAAEHMHPAVYDYVASGAGTERTVESNEDAFQQWRILPRIPHRTVELCPNRGPHRQKDDF